uniref:Uncharacterized protein n=1 Tax=Myoviridae sp. ctIty1 TaxID=2827673 RepID=A0A8S5THA8_9CAUD|nr:MAG TPA: hypothetical protein [Myoviridae sp. ctIty1]
MNLHDFPGCMERIILKTRDTSNGGSYNTEISTP